ncbi:MAG: AmmeMemoRadiSam system protein B [Pseudomonadota bacterium]
MRIQKPVVAGTFYPAEPAALHRMTAELLAAREGRVVPTPKALILPHAGYRFSGAAAAAGVSRLATDAGIERVVILGPSHYHRFEGIALPAAEALETPLGTLPVDAAAAALLDLPEVNVVEQAFSREHAIEVELPLLQARIGGFAVLPLVVGKIETERLAEILQAVWGGAETLVVISTDLTHFLTAEACREIDLQTARKVELADPVGLTSAEACGVRPLAAFLTLAHRHGLRVTRLALTHSGKATGDLARVVGYGAWMAHWPRQQTLAEDLRLETLEIARKALISRAARGKTPGIQLSSFAQPLQTTAASFVTLTKADKLRGCIGSLKAHQPAIQDIVMNAAKAGFEDPRFSAMTTEEIAETEIEIALLSRPAPMAFSGEGDLLEQLRPGEDGLILQSGTHRGTFLPKVWSSLRDRKSFWHGLKKKAGLPVDDWSVDMKVWRYSTETFGTEPR